MLSPPYPSVTETVRKRMSRLGLRAFQCVGFVRARSAFVGDARGTVRNASVTRALCLVKRRRDDRTRAGQRGLSR